MFECLKSQWEPVHPRVEHAPSGIASRNTALPRNEPARLLLCGDSGAFEHWDTCWYLILLGKKHGKNNNLHPRSCVQPYHNKSPHPEVRIHFPAGGLGAVKSPDCPASAIPRQSTGRFPPQKMEFIFPIPTHCLCAREACAGIRHGGDGSSFLLQHSQSRTHSVLFHVIPIKKWFYFFPEGIKTSICALSFSLALEGDDAL